MPLKLYMHPLSSFCQKVLVALYENATPFEPELVDLGNEISRADFLKVWPVGQFPVLRDGDRVIPESSIIIEYLAQHYPGKIPLIPDDADRARETRQEDRFYDLRVQVPMQKIVGDRMRPDGQKDPFGVQQARAQLQTAYSLIDRTMSTRLWATGDQFTMADCAAAPALFYANWALPLSGNLRHARAYHDRLMLRPSYVRAIEEARPYFALFPQAATETA